MEPIHWVETNGAVLRTSHDEFRDHLASGPLRVKYGIDPTGTEVHLGHAVALRKLRQFQDEGHRPILIIGDITAMIGDPSGRDKTRPGLSKEQVRENASKYLEQIAKIIKVPDEDIHWNSDWFDHFEIRDVIRLMGQSTVQQLLHREDFLTRYKGEKPIGLHEFLYPMLQARDSVEVEADVEIGGTEQLFTMMLAHDLQKIEDPEAIPQAVVTVPLLRGTDGIQKMGKSLNNFISVREAPFEMFSKVMSIPDELLVEWFSLLTDFDGDPTGRLRETPRDAKLVLARLLVENFHNPDAGVESTRMWISRFSKKSDPEEIREVHIPPDTYHDNKTSICHLMQKVGLTDTISQARRLIVPTSGVTIGPFRTKVTDPNLMVEIHDGLILRIGSRKIVKVRT